MSIPILERFFGAEIKGSSIEFKIEIVIYLLVGNQKLVSRKHNISHPAPGYCPSTSITQVCSREPQNVSKEDTIDLWMRTATQPVQASTQIDAWRLLSTIGDL
jgi:hypothetical protein